MSWIRIILVSCSLFLSSSCGGNSTTNPAATPLVDREGARLTVVQRQTAGYPANDSKVHVSLGDITAGQVLLTVRDTDNHVLIAQTSAREGEARGFEYGRQRYLLCIDRLVNHLTGDDFAELRIIPADALSENERIAAAIRRVRVSGLKFIRNGKTHGSADAADHLQRKWDAVGDRIKTFDDFVTQIASRSSLSGEEYEVEFPDGTRKPAGAWIREGARQ